MNFEPEPNFVAYILAAALLIVAVVTQLAANGRIGRNGFMGMRIPPTMASDAAWVAGHRAAAVVTWAGFALTTLAAVAAQITTLGATPGIVLFVLTLAGAVAAAWRGAKSV